MEIGLQHLLMELDAGGGKQKSASKHLVSATKGMELPFNKRFWKTGGGGRQKIWKEN